MQKCNEKCMKGMGRRLAPMALLKEAKKGILRRRRLDAHGGGMKEMCTMIDCVKGEDSCAGMKEMMMADPGAKDAADCMCDSAVMGAMDAMMKASEKDGACYMEDGAEQDMCTAPEACITVMKDVNKQLSSNDGCKSTYKAMKCDMSAEDEKCFDEKIGGGAEEEAAADHAGRSVAVPAGIIAAVVLAVTKL
jgi:hypothetical protein